MESAVVTFNAQHGARSTKGGYAYPAPTGSSASSVPARRSSDVTVAKVKILVPRTERSR